jgi:methyl-accepting chemotaxis protein/DNA-binding LacI/PurR family transcriptional regulator
MSKGAFGVLRQGERLTIGYMNQNLQEAWAILPWRGATDSARKHGVNLVSLHGNSIREKSGYMAEENAIYDLVRNKKIDGLIVWHGHLTKNLDKNGVDDFFRSYGVPLVTVEGEHERYPCVTYGNYAGMKLLMSHLIDHHRFSKIGYVGLVKNHSGFEARHRGYLDSMREHGLKIEDYFVRPWCQWDRTFEGRPVDELLDQWLVSALSEGMEAIVGSADPNAAWVVGRLEKAGKRVPYDVSVVGFDGFQEYRVLTPSLTTIYPSWFEVGSKAVDVIVDIIQKKTVAKKTEVAPVLVTAQTCGCLEQSIVLAGNASGRGAVHARGKKAIERIDGLLSPEGAGTRQSYGESLLAALMRDARGKGGNSFLSLVDMSMRESIRRALDLGIWQDVLSLLRIRLGAELLTPLQRKSAEVVLHQARVLASIISSRNQENAKYGEISMMNAQQYFGLRLISTFDLEEIVELIVKDLPAINIKECYISLYDNPKSYKYPDPVPEWSTLILAYTEKGRIPLPKEGLRFPTRQMVPDDLWKSDGAKNLSVNALFFQDNQIGFAVFDAGIMTGSVYGRLASQISGALQGAMLLSRINSHSLVLEKGIDTLFKSIAEMAASIEAVTDHIFKQSAAVEESASAIEQMRQNIARISEISNGAASVSRNLDSASVEAVGSIKKLIEGIRTVQDNSINIRNLLELMRETAEKVKLLALNAAIEAVHAGAWGRGFSIVSGEIRKLADDTNANLNKIGSVIGTLLGDIDLSSTLAGQIGGNLDGIIQGSRLNSDLSTQLSSAMKEQDHGAGEVLGSVTELVRITSEIKSAMSEQVRSTEDFKKALAELRNLTKTKG